MSGPGRDAVLARLRDVHDPELHRSIVDLGMVGDVDVAHHPQVDDAAVQLGVVDVPQAGEDGVAAGPAHMNIRA